MNPETTSAAPAKKSFTRFFPVIARILLGFVFFAGGLYFFLANPPPTTGMPEAAIAFQTALMKSGYFMPLLKATETLCGALLLLNCFVPLALAVLAPIIVNITAFLAFLMPGMVVMAVVLVVLELYLAWSYRSAYRSMLACRVTPG